MLSKATKIKGKKIDNLLRLILKVIKSFGCSKIQRTCWHKNNFKVSGKSRKINLLTKLNRFDYLCNSLEIKRLKSSQQPTYLQAVLNRIRMEQIPEPLTPTRLENGNSESRGRRLRSAAAGSIRVTKGLAWD